MNSVDVYVEIGKQRTFASAVQWPGWSRSGPDEAGALETLAAYGPRYARVLDGTELGFVPPEGSTALRVVERMPGNASTDFGALSPASAYDAGATSEAELQRFVTILNAGWRAFDAALAAARGRPMRFGPRGGGRDQERLERHVIDSEAGYCTMLSWSVDAGAGIDERRTRTRQAVLAALARAAHGDAPLTGPRGGKRWTPRYFVRHTAWHLLDHLWELEDRTVWTFEQPAPLV